MNGANPCGGECGCDRVFPRRVELPFAVVVVEQAFGIGGAEAAVHFLMGRFLAHARHGGDAHLFREMPQVHIQKRAVEHDGEERQAVFVLLTVERSDEPARGVRHKCDLRAALAFYLRHRAVYVGEVFVEVEHHEGVLVRKFGTAVFAQVERIETVAVVVEEMRHFRLEEIIVVAVHIEQGRAGGGLFLGADERGHHLAFVIVGHIDGLADEILSQNVLLIAFGHRLRAEHRHHQKRKPQKGDSLFHAAGCCWLGKDNRKRGNV